MFWHYLLTALRHLARNKLYSFINIVGLSSGLACAIFIILFVKNEISYDRWIPDSANLYRVELSYHMPGRDPVLLAQAPYPLLRTMQDHIPEVTAVAHVVPERMTVSLGDRQFAETVTVVDPTFFQVIKLPLLVGDPASVLAQPESIVLAQRVARKYFGRQDPVGKILMLSATEGWNCNHEDSACLSAAHAVTVAGVLQDLPGNTQLVADLILPNTSQADVITQYRKEQAWTSTDGGYAYVALASGASSETVMAKLPALLDQTINSSNLRGMRASDLVHFRLTQFWNVHLWSDNYGGMKPAGSWNMVRGFAIIAVLIVLVACINFMNLATARAMRRAREIAVRKAVGATQSQLIVQFLGEAVLTALLSLAVALALVEMLLPAYNSFLDQSIQFNYLTEWRLALLLLAGAIAAGLLSGVYPALVLAAFRPVIVLKTSSPALSGSQALRNAMVVSQFAVSIGLGIAAIVVFAQISFVRQIDFGFERDGTIVIRGISKLTTSQRESFASALGSNQDIADVALSNAAPFDLGNASNDLVQVPGESQTFTAHIISITPNYTALYGMRLLAGRFLSAAYGQDLSSRGAQRNVLINSEAAHRCGYTPQQAIGKTIVMDNEHVNIAGVVGDARIDGVRDAIVPVFYKVEPADYTLLSVRLRGERVPAALDYIDKTWRSFVPSSAIQRYSLRDVFDGLFKADEKQGAMFGIFVALAIVVSCLGLFGLAAFTTERRTREIGIRKVFGARTIDVTLLLLWQFSIPVLIANIIAWPVAYYCLRHWLESFSARIVLSPLYFLAAAALALAVAWATVFVHAFRIARASPIDALRHE